MVIVGVVSAYFGGIVDKIIMRLIDIMLAFPYILLTIVIVAVLGPSLVNAMIAIGISQIPSYARIVRASVLAEKENDYVLAERALGASDLELMFKSILPNCFRPRIRSSYPGYRYGHSGIGGPLFSVDWVLSLPLPSGDL